MDLFLYKALAISLPISALILILWASAPLLKKTYCVRWRYFVWFFLGARLLFPFSVGGEEPLLQVAVPTSSAQALLPTNALPMTETWSISAGQLLAGLWLAGCLIVFSFQLIRYFEFQDFVERWSIAPSRVILDRFTSLSQSLGVKTPVRCILCRGISSPLAMGFFRPKVVLPANLPFSELDLVLTHELIHIRRRDVWYKLFFILVSSIYWFNPAVWLMQRLAVKDLEFLCDSQVVEGQDPEFKKRYCQAILSGVQSQAHPVPLTTCFHSGKKTLLARFSNILDLRKKKKGIILTLVVCGAALLAGNLIGIAAEKTVQKLEENTVLSAPVFPVPTLAPTATPSISQASPTATPSPSPTPTFSPNILSPSPSAVPSAAPVVSIAVPNPASPTPVSPPSPTPSVSPMLSEDGYVYHGVIPLEGLSLSFTIPSDGTMNFSQSIEKGWDMQVQVVSDSGKTLYDSSNYRSIPRPVTAIPVSAGERPTLILLPISKAASSQEAPTGSIFIYGQPAA